MRKIIQTRRIWLSISGVMVITSIVFLALWGLNFGIDYTGGALMEVKFNGDRPETNKVIESLKDIQLGSLVVQPVDEKGLILRFQNTEENIHQEVFARLNKMAGQIASSSEIKIESSTATSTVNSTSSVSMIDIVSSNETVEELRYDSIGPSIGQELKRKSVYAIVIVITCIILYIAWAFRKVSRPVASWKYGVAAAIALFHDVTIVLGVFAFLGEFYNVEVSTAFVAAVLTVLGYSVNDTIVVFDRIRENLPKSDLDFENTVNISVNQTVARSINTSMTALLVLISILIFGGASIRDFALALAIGVFVGTYSSIFIASPVLVIWEKAKR